MLPVPDRSPATPAAATPSPFFPDGRSMYERMLAGDPYIAADPRLEELSTAAALLTEQYNATSVTEPALRRRLLSQLLASLGEEVVIRPPFHVDYGRFISIGDRTFANFGLMVLDVAPVRIGADVQIGTNVQLLTPTHPLEPGPRRDKWEGAEPITIEDNVWLGGGVIVGPGVTIGENTVVGAGAVVTRDLPANVVALGVPARPVKDLPADPDGGWSRMAVDS
ncbi:sugar O-acetyltransferase [Citricoccus muralis]|uniref:Maltose O-acetyltransferase n=1 Tax=Citricoccus muralis TaxID=169134 RepID=A0A3D9LCC5_9MICC|nr:maltose O-acetyltransferase [Citricoccus muralis]